MFEVSDRIVTVRQGEVVASEAVVDTSINREWRTCRSRLRQRKGRKVVQVAPEVEFAGRSSRSGVEGELSMSGRGEVAAVLLQTERLVDFVTQIFAALGSDRPEAETVSHFLVNSNLTGRETAWRSPSFATSAT